MYVGVDDTDSMSWMCTTYLARELIASLPQYDLIGYPRLVRLNPAVPWKTRGNGAICLRFGRGGGRTFNVGEIQGRRITAFERLLRPADPDELFGVAMDLVRRWSRVEEGASPGVVVTPVKPSQGLYWKAVRELVDRDEVLTELAGIGAIWNGLSGARGVIGGAASIAWRPRDRTFELLAYRHRKRWGTERAVDEGSVMEMDRAHPSTFNNYDYQERKMVITPSSPCPILYGIRGEGPDELFVASEVLDTETRESLLVFLTNQGTDDHVMTTFSRMTPFSSYSITGEVSEPPRDLEGGHVVLGMSTPDGQLEVTAYEPSKGFRAIVRSLGPGDEIRVMGELRDRPRTLNLEKLEILRLSNAHRKISNPICKRCGKRMKSIGKGKGYRCRGCGERVEESGAEFEPLKRNLGPGWYEPPVSARRHLSKPLKRMGGP